MSDDPPAVLRDGGVIRSGFNETLDEWVHLATSGKDYLLALEAREREETGIPTLKVRFNKVFGYYIEVTRVHSHKVPDHYVRKQTLTNAERYFTEELKEFEDKVLNAESQRSVLESELFLSLRESIAKSAAEIAQTALALADLDALASSPKSHIRGTTADPSWTMEMSSISWMQDIQWSRRLAERVCPKFYSPGPGSSESHCIDRSEHGWEVNGDASGGAGHIDGPNGRFCAGILRPYRCR